MRMDKSQTDMPITLLNTEIKAHKTKRFARTIEEKKRLTRYESIGNQRSREKGKNERNKDNINHKAVVMP